MRIVLISFLAALAAAAVDVTPSEASFFNKRFCTFGGGFNSSGEADCSYNTWQQCIASASGLGRYCGENPRWTPEQPAPRSRERVRRGYQ